MRLVSMVLVLMKLLLNKDMNSALSLLACACRW